MATSLRSSQAQQIRHSVRSAQRALPVDFPCNSGTAAAVFAAASVGRGCPSPALLCAPVPVAVAAGTGWAGSASRPCSSFPACYRPDGRSPPVGPHIKVSAALLAIISQQREDCNSPPRCGSSSAPQFQAAVAAQTCRLQVRLFSRLQLLTSSCRLSNCRGDRVVPPYLLPAWVKSEIFPTLSPLPNGAYGMPAK